MQAVTTIFGFTGATFYSLSLQVYFLLVIKYDIDDAKIAKYVEPIFHIIPIAYSSASMIAMLATKNYNTVDELVICSIDSRPLNCYNDPDIDCISKGNPETMKQILAVSSLMTIFALNCIMMVMIWFAVYFQTKKSESYRYSWMVSTRVPGEGHTDQEHKDGNTTTIDRPLHATWKSRFWH